MVNTKKITGSTLALIVVSVLLVMSLALGATLAWFSAADDSSSTITFANEFTIKITDSDEGDDFGIITAGSQVIPGSVVSLDAKIDANYTAEVAGTTQNVPMLLRISFQLAVKKGLIEENDYRDTIPGDPDLASIYEAFYDSIQKALFDTKEWVLYNGYFYFVGGYENANAYDMTAAANTPGATGNDLIFGAKYTAATNKGIMFDEYDEENLGNILATKLTSVYTSDTKATITILDANDWFRLSGKGFKNTVAGATVGIKLVAQAVQDSIYDTNGTSKENIVPTVENASNIFDEAFEAEVE